MTRVRNTQDGYTCNWWQEWETHKSGFICLCQKPSPSGALLGSSIGDENYHSHENCIQIWFCLFDFFVCIFLDLFWIGEQQNLNKTESATIFALVPLPLESVHFRLLITWTNKVTLLKHALRSVLRYMDENTIGLTWENVSSSSFYSLSTTAVTLHVS